MSNTAQPFKIDFFATQTGGGGGLPPATLKPRVATGGFPKPPAKASSASPSPAPAYTAPVSINRGLIEKRIRLCESHHSRWLKWRAANTAKLLAWVESQPGYCPLVAARMAYESKLRRGFKAKHNRA